MNYGFVKVAAAVPHVKVADCFYNIQQIEGLMRQASQKEVQIIAFPELSVTSYTLHGLVLARDLTQKRRESLAGFSEQHRRSGFTNDRMVARLSAEAN